MQQDAYAHTSVHPDLALLECAPQGPICCLVLEGACAAPDALGIAPFAAYCYEGGCALLFERPQADGWQAALSDEGPGGSVRWVKIADGIFLPRLPHFLSSGR
ncbi:MAG: hypothetical protein IKU38_04515, partial [Clostridia bacterium]|nr:hypothetical protein [Clostridia bacterium]